MATTSEIQVTEAYIGLLGRAPDPAGLAYWTAQLDAAVAAGQDATIALKKLTNDIALSPEYSTGIGVNVPSEGNPSQVQADAIVTALYRNLFDRDPTPADLAYWTPQLTGGSTTAPEMTLNLITAAKSNTAKPTDGDILGYKQQAATYYVENVSQDNFSKDTATQAVDPVNGPTTLATSKAMTDQVASGVGITTDLASIGASNDVPMSASDDVVTGTVGTGATYKTGGDTQKINDSFTGDNDTLTLTGNAGFTFGQVKNVENINVSLADTLGGGFSAIDAANVVGGTINLDVADKVTIAGVELAGETVATVSNLGTALSTTDVTNLTVSSAAAAASITADSDAATVTVNEIEANDTTITMSAATSTLNLDGTNADATTDKAAISAVGKVALDVSAGVGNDQVENLTLSGNGAAVTYTITGNNTPTASNLTVAGSQDVTLAGGSAQFDAIASFNDVSTGGSTTLSLSDGGDATVDVANFGVLSGGIELTGNFNGSLEVTTGNTIKVAATQTNALTVVTNDDGVTSSLTLDIDNDTAGITTTDVDALTIDFGTRNTTIDSLNAGDNDAAVTIVGSNANDITITNALASGDLVANGNDTNFGSIDADGDIDVTAAENFTVGNLKVDNDITVTANDIDISGSFDTVNTGGTVKLTATSGNVDISGAAKTHDVQGTLTVSAGGEFTTVSAFSVDNDVSITADDFKATAATTVKSGDLEATVTNDITLGGNVNVDSGNVVLKTTNGAGAVNGVVQTGGSLVVDNDITIESADNVTLLVTTNTDTEGGSTTITAANDVNLDGAVTADKNLSVTSTNKDIDSVGFTLTADNDIELNAGDQVKAAGLVTVDGNVTVTAGNEVTIGTANTASDVDGILKVTAGSTADGTVTVSGAINAENDVTITGSKVDIDKDVTSQKNDIVITAANDIALTDGGAVTLEATTGSITVTSTNGVAGTATADITVENAADQIKAQNDVTLKADDIKTGIVTSTGVGSITITATNDVDIDGAVSTTGAGSITITAGEVVGGAGDSINVAANITGQNDVTITASAGGEIDLNATTVKSNTAGDVMITGGEIDAAGGTVQAVLGDITINATNDTETSTIGTLNADAGTVTFLSGNFAVTQIDADAGGVTIAGDAQGSFATVNAKDSEVRLTTTNDVTMTTVDTEAVVGTGGGDYALGTVTSSTQTAVQITTGAGNDSMTLNGDERYTVITGEGIDQITGSDSAANTVVNTGGGDDVLTITAADFQGTVDMGAGTGDKVILPGAGATIAAGAVWQNIEILQLAGNVTVSAAQLANDTSYEIVGANGVVTATGVTSIDLSNVSFQAGNTSSFNLTGTSAADSITASDAADTITVTTTTSANSDTMDGGLGTDTLAIVDAGSGAAVAHTFATDSKLANIENITIQSDDGVTLTLTGQTENFAIATAAAGGAASTLAITGGSGVETITLTPAHYTNSTIVGGGGDDVIALGAAANVDTLQWTSGSGKDTISGFDTGEDKLSFDGVITGLTATTGTAVTAGALVAGALTDDRVNVIDDGTTALTAGGAQAIADGTDLTDVAAYLAEGYTTTAAGDAAVFVISGLGGKTYIYTFLDDGNGDGIDAAELTLIGVVTEESAAAIVAGDIG